jgi:hypothetical protein
LIPVTALEGFLQFTQGHRIAQRKTSALGAA